MAICDSYAGGPKNLALPATVVSLAYFRVAPLGPARKLKGFGCLENCAMRCALGVAFCGVMVFNLMADEPSERLKTIWEKREQWLAGLQRQADSQAAGRQRGEVSRDVRAAERQLTALKEELESKPDAKRVADLKEKLSSPRWNEAMKAMFKAELKTETSKKPNARRTAELKKEIKETESRIAELQEAAKRPADAPDVVSDKRADLSQWPPLDASGFSVGDIGKLPPFPVGVFKSESQKMRLVTIANQLQRGEPASASDRKFLARFGPQSAIKGWHNVRIIQVIDDGEALVTIHDIGDAGSLDAPTFWLRAIDTSKLTDDSTIAVNEVVEVTGTKKYDTAAGATKTVFVIEPFDVEQLRPFMK